MSLHFTNLAAHTRHRKTTISFSLGFPWNFLLEGGMAGSGHITPMVLNGRAKILGYLGHLQRAGRLRRTIQTSTFPPRVPFQQPDRTCQQDQHCSPTGKSLWFGEATVLPRGALYLHPLAASPLISDVFCSLYSCYWQEIHEPSNLHLLMHEVPPI